MKKFEGKSRKLPVSYFAGAALAICLELLSSVYEETCIEPVSLEIEEMESEGCLERKYMDQIRPMLLEVEGEIVFPLAGLYDTDMFILNYQKFY